MTMMGRRIQALTYAAAAAGSAITTTTLAFTSPTSRSCYRHLPFIPNKRCGIIPSSALDVMSNNDDGKSSILTSLTKIFTQATDNNNVNSSIELIETEEARQKRLRLERLATIELGEQRRQARVNEDKFAYLFLFALQLLPLLGNDRIESIAYFFGVAVTTVYLGGRQEVIDKPEMVTKDNALYAPIGASLAIGGLYTLLKVGIDITSLYAIMVTVFGALAISGKISSSPQPSFVLQTGTIALLMVPSLSVKISACHYCAMYSQGLILPKQMYPCQSLWRTN